MISIGNVASLDRVRECLSREVRSKPILAQDFAQKSGEFAVTMALRAACPGATTPAAGLAALSTSKTSAIHSRHGVPVKRRSTRDGANCVCELSESNESLDSKCNPSGLVEFHPLIGFFEVNCVVERCRVLA